MDVRRKRITEITIETDRTLLFTRGRRRPPEWCPVCRAEVQPLTAFEAAALARVSSHTVYAWAEAGRLHGRLTPEGVLLVCPDSLQDAGRAV